MTTTHEYIALDKSGRSTYCDVNIRVEYPINCEIVVPGECIDHSVIRECPDINDNVCNEITICNEYSESFQVTWSYPEKACFNDEPLTLDAKVQAKCIDDDTIIYLGSHNLTKAAWGKFVKNYSKYCLNNYELGILFPPVKNSKN